MKQITVTVFSIDELSADAQTKALDNMRYTNIHHQWWEPAFDSFGELSRSIGIEVNLQETYFNGFYHQRQGSSFTAEVDVLKLIDALKTGSWKSTHPQLELTGYKEIANKQLLAVMKTGKIQVSAYVKPINRETSIDVDMLIDYLPHYSSRYAKLDIELEKLKDHIEDVCNELNNFLFSTLREEYEYLLSDEQVKETLRCNDYHFTGEGKLF